VNPYDVYGVAAALDRALTMPLEERQERHARQLAALQLNDIAAWRRHCLAALDGEPVPGDAAGSAADRPPVAGLAAE
jgi:trehalose 6-phosphate synthase